MSEQTRPVQLTHEEALFLFQACDKVPLPGPDVKRLAASAQEKLGTLDYRDLPSAPAPPVVQ